MVLLTLVGAAFQAYYPGGVWLMAATILALSARMGLAQNEKHGRLSFIGGLVFWVVLQTYLGRANPGKDVSTTMVLLEVFVVAAFPTLFWIVFLDGTQQNRDVAEAVSLSGDRQKELKDRLDRMQAESAGLQAESDEWTHLFSVTKSVGVVIREEEMVEVVKETVHTHLKHPAYMFLIAHGGSLQVRAQEGFDENMLRGATFSSGNNTLASWFARQKEPILVDDLRQDSRFPGSMFPFRAVMVLPMWIKETSLGILLVFNERSQAFSRQDFTRTWILCNQLALGVGKALLYERVEELSITDGLTKLFRHRYFQERLDQELDRARRYGRTLTFLMADLDHFKKYNDAHGHPEGDEMLVLASKLMGVHFPRPALLARYGGEEFGILVPEVTREKAVEMAVNFRKALESTHPPAAAAKSPMTVSIGCASFPADGQTKRDLVARADLALYRAKAEGRNRVCCYEPNMEGQKSKA